MLHGSCAAMKKREISILMSNEDEAGEKAKVRSMKKVIGYFN